MAQEETQKGTPSQQSGTTNTFTGGMVKDPIDLYKKSDTYTHARNMVNMLGDGQLYGKSAEPANIRSATIPYTPIGFIYLSDDQWIVFSTNNTISEIGIFVDATNSYTTLMNDAATLTAGLTGLGFKTTNLITGTSRRGYDCGYDVYWSDGGLNPDRVLNTATCPWTIGAITTPKTFSNPWIQNCLTISACLVCNNTNKIDIQQLRIAPLLDIPCLKLSKSTSGGLLPNGSYQVCIAYAINSIKCTDYLAFSDVYSTFTHLNNGGCIDLTIEGIGNNTKIRFTEMEVVVVSMVNQQVQAKRLGIYSTNQSKITIDNIDITLPNIPLEKLPLSSPAIVSSDAIFGISNYLTRVGPKERPDFNYQILANQIRTWWIAVEYPENYYQVGGNNYGMNVGYLRGEVYSLYIRWVYNTGDKSASYHIPSRDVPTAPGSWISYAVGGPTIPGSISTIAHGRTGVYVSNERYPDRSPAVWGNNLCGQKIMHHQMPDQSTFGGTTLSHFNPNGAPATGTPSTISVLGLYFDNIASPVDNNGNLIKDIVGYEILRSSRDGNQSILAKGMVNNMKLVYEHGTYNGSDVFTPQIHANYPYNDLGIDVFLTKNYDNIKQGEAGNGFRDPIPDYDNGGFQKNMFSFHSPDTAFNQPYLGSGKLELVMTVNGESNGLFETPWKHPMFKVLTNFDSWLSTALSLFNSVIQAVNIVKALQGGNLPDITLAATESVPMSSSLFSQNNYSLTLAGTDVSTGAKIATGLIAGAFLIAFLPLQMKIFSEQFLTIIKGLIPPRQYSAQYNSWGYYNTPKPIPKSTFTIYDYQYIKDKIQSFGGLTVNNLYRNNYVLLKSDEIPPYYGDDKSRFNLSNFGDEHNQLPLGNWFTNTIGSYYGTYRIPQLTQYGQIDSTKQIPIGCTQQTIPSTTAFKSNVMFSGDTYINRYTEKNPFMFFNDWLVNAPDDFKYDYRNYMNVPYPMYWINNDVVSSSLLNIASYNRRLDGPLNTFTFAAATAFNFSSLFYVKTGFFYLFCNGVRDFFVESSINVGYRDWEDSVSKMFYDPYRSSRDFIREMFRSDIIKSNIFYKYDYSLSASRFINQFISWGSCLRRDYDPVLAYSCFAYYPRRVAYSLPQEEEQMQDNWKIFLPNNYKDFNDRVYAIKDLHKTGAIFLMESSSPMMFAGVESIPSKSGTEYSVGTGLLFQQTLQSLNNIDDSYEYASCQSRLGIINTPHGAFWISQKTGKIFNLLHGQLTDIGETGGLKYHLLKYLPSQLLTSFPNYPLIDNPVSGIGCQLIYDSVYQILYISKKDYVPKPGQTVNYSNGQWYLGPCPPNTYYTGNTNPNAILCLPCGIVFGSISSCPGTIVNFGDPNYFDNAGWTLSYDCVRKEFISWHDWNPSLHVPSKNHFFTTNGLSGQLWRHNNTTQLFANFYNQNYPVEIEYYTNTQVSETILQSVEWLLESYQYAPNGVDKFLNYDQSFDYIMVHNKEQNSTIQKMVLKPWDDPYAALQYPNFIGSTREVLYQKVENKYRINDFYDFTANRAAPSSPAPLGNTPMITTNPDGYTFSTNTAYFNLSKPWNQQKRMRYTGTRIFMRKTMLGTNSLTIRYANTKNQISPR